MDDTISFALEGRKTFFIATEQSLLPESYLEDYLTRGYETYIIPDDRNCPLVKKVETIINIFDDSILFFYIDAEVMGLNWKIYIKQLQERHGEHVLIGVLYSKRHNEEERRRIEKYYLFDVGIQGGCISLEYQKGSCEHYRRCPSGCEGERSDGRAGACKCDEHHGQRIHK